MRRTNMKYTPSINIAQTTFNPAGYIVTQNVFRSVEQPKTIRNIQT